MKPTPVQARGLKALNTPYDERRNGPRLYLWFSRDLEGKPEGIYEVSNKSMNGTRVRASSAKVLLRNGWIEEKGDGFGYYIISQMGREILELLSDIDFISKTPSKPIWSTLDIIDALNEKYRTLSEEGFDDAPVWIYFDELQSSSGRGNRVDFWAMACWHSLGYKRISYEVKISNT